MSDGAPARAALEAATPRAAGATARVGREPRTDPPDPKLSWGPLEALEVLAAADGITLCRAHDPVAEVDVELRLYDLGAPAPRRRFTEVVEESARRARLRHPHLSWVLGAEEHHGFWGIWTEETRGQSLADLLSERGPLDAAQAAALGGELCGALAALHAHGLTQRRLDAMHVWIAADGRARLRDAYPDVHGTASETWRLRHQAPRRPPAVDPTAADDLRALGELLLVALQGNGADPATARQSFGRHRVPAELAEVIDRATASSPGQRHVSAVEMAEALALAHERATRARPGERVERTIRGDDDRASSPGRRLWQHAALALATLVALALMAAIVWTASE